MICSKCGNENQEGSMFCNKCGANLQETTEVSINEENISQENKINEKPKKHNLKNKIIISILSIILISIISGGAFYYKKIEDKKNYQTKFSKTTIDILTETVIVETMCGKVSDTWDSAIKSRYTDFNTELASLKDKWKKDGSISKRTDAKSNIEKEMKELQNPPKEYEEAYKLFVELYSTYGQIYSQAITPQGSLNSYNQDVNAKESEFDKTYSKIKVLEPDIETIGKKNN